MNDRERLEAIVKVVRQYLPPDGIYGKEAMGKIIELVDPLPPKKEWVGLTDREIEHELTQEFAHWWNRHVSVCRAIETKLKDKNT